MNKINILLDSCCTIFLVSGLGMSSFMTVPQIARQSALKDTAPHIAGVSSIIGTVESAIAQLSNSLVLDRQDALIPKGSGTRELTSFEKYRIEKEIAQLEKKAQTEFDRDNVNLAMKLWYRQLRLTRFIDTEAEIISLGKIGAIAWEENRSEDVRNIANRLIAIQTEESTKKRLTPNLLDELAIAYQAVRYLDKAIDVYQLILVEEKKTYNSVAKEKLLNKLGELYLGIFDYGNAANIYQELLDDNSSKEDREIQLKRLIEIYHHGRFTNKAISTRKLLIVQYIEAEKNNQIPILELANARDRVTLKQFDLAMKTYHLVFEKASTTRQLAIARDALIGIGQLYQQQEKLEPAIEIYKKLLTVEKQADNSYGAIDTYDTLGKIYLKLNQPDRAANSFQEALVIAKEFDYKVKYFNRQIEKTNLKSNSQ
ncbi:tetratricopeptide repeat protein [Waterburya agarophytonicola K14]|uniref:Tetratricopeptide repeat protein n=1 Tax=Waterburya agarophytonicola KI4 TaxID=2874699 RepID=A0A964BP32_9CYAN|nr:tetratricopeptide repeat protein [Waterburya agarophytonicola]MCC0175561.1 tetratricopeptide repeat protein [Waterburya agarophytonicola KI4]